MSTHSIVLLAAALRTWLAEQDYQQQTTKRLETLALVGLTFEAAELK